MLRKMYCLDNIYIMKILMETLQTTASITVTPTSLDDLLDCGTFLNLFYQYYKNKARGGYIKLNHNFSCEYNKGRVRKQLLVNLHKVNPEEHPITRHRVIKAGFFGRDKYKSRM